MYEAKKSLESETKSMTGGLGPGEQAEQRWAGSFTATILRGKGEPESVDGFRVRGRSRGIWITL